MKRAQEHIKEYGEATTIHGVRYITESNVHWFERFFWMLAIVTCTIFCSIGVSNLYVKWKSTPVITKLARTLSNISEIPFPAITFCPENKLSEESAKRLIKLNDAYLRNIRNINYSFSEEDLTLIAYSKYLCSYYGLFRGLNINLTQKYVAGFLELVPPIDEIFSSCYGKCDLTPILTHYEICYTYNMVKNTDLFTERFDFSRSFPIKNNISDSQWTPKDGYSINGDKGRYPEEGDYNLGFHRKKFMLKTKITSKYGNICNVRQHVRIFVHSPVELPLPYTNYFLVSGNQEMKITIHPDVTIPEEESEIKNFVPEKRGCKFFEEIEKPIFKHRTDINCLNERFSRKFLETCNCSAFYIPTKNSENVSIRYCNAREHHNCNRISFEDDCLSNCYDYSYTYHVSSAPLTPLIKSDETQLHSVINFHFADSTYYKKIRTVLYGNIDFLANIGGIMGLFTGFSVTSVIEIIYFISLRICCKIKRDRKRKKLRRLKSTEEKELC